MHENLELAATALGLDLSHIAAASERTETLRCNFHSAVIQELRDNLGTSFDPDTSPLDIVLCGSFGRAEVTTGSDIDHLLVAHELVYDPELIHAFRRAAVSAAEQIGAGKPGATGTFGQGLVSASGLIDQIGLEGDTNQNMTHRLLLLEESVPVLSSYRHAKLMRAIVKRYLFDYSQHPKSGIPRFLLNDCVRYWRTLAVDYQAKRWRDMQEGSGLRYFKLRSSRKLAFAGTLVTLFVPAISGTEVDEELLFEQFSAPPLARLAQLARFLPDGTSGAQVLSELLAAADTTLALLAQDSFREAMKGVSDFYVEAPDSVFGRARQLTETIQTSLQQLFTCTSPFIGEPKIFESSEDLNMKYLHDRYLIF